ncbi:MAG: hypothetical protein ACI4WY_04625 [Anaerovoracaceae bacterium]
MASGIGLGSAIKNFADIVNRKSPAQATSTKPVTIVSPSGSSGGSSGGTLYKIGDSGYAVDQVGNFLVNNGYMGSYSGKYDNNMQNALVQAKQDLLGPNSANGGAYKGATFGNATLNAIAQANQNAQNLLIQQQIEAALAPYQDMQAYYDNMLAMQQEQFAQQQAAAKQNTQAAIDNIYSNKGNIEDAYQKAQRENYINQVLQGNQMGDYLAASGFTGGMSESTMQGLQNTYANNRQQAMSERDQALLELDKLAAQAQVSGNSDLADIANSYYDNYINMLNNQAQMNYQISQDKQAQANADRQYQLQLAQQQFEQQQYKNQLAQSQKDAQTAASKEKAENDFNTFLNTFEGKYNKKATYEQWIKNLQAMDDPYGYNKQKIAYLRQYINSTFGGQQASGANGSTYSTSTTQAPGKTTTTTTYKPTTAATGLITQISSRFPAGITAEAKGNAVLNAVKNALSNGTITNQDADYILTQFGY